MEFPWAQLGGQSELLRIDPVGFLLEQFAPITVLPCVGVSLSGLIQEVTVDVAKSHDFDIRVCSKRLKVLFTPSPDPDASVP